MSTIKFTAFLMLSVFALLLLSVSSTKSTDVLTPVLTEEEQILNVPELHPKETSLTGKEKVLSWIIKRKIDRQMRRQQKLENRQQGVPTDTEKPKMNGFATAAGIAGGLLVIPFFWPLALIAVIAAPTFGIIALRQIKREPGRWRGKGWATFGLVIGIITLLLIGIFLLTFSLDFSLDFF